MSTPPLTVFPTSTKQGHSLAEAVAALGRREGYTVTVVEGASQGDVLKACLGPGVVVFDATIEPNDRHNYAIALYMLKSIPFVLVVSRCPRCAARTKRSASGKPPANFADLLSFDLRQVIDSTGSNLQVIPRHVVAASVVKGKGKVVCRDCHTGLTVHDGPLRYWFYPVRTKSGPPPVDLPTGPGGVILEHRPVYLLDYVIMYCIDSQPQSMV